MHIPSVETLERRTLLAGVTLLTHGWNGHLSGFMDQAAKDITNRMGGPSEVAEYKLKIGIGANGLEVKDFSHVAGTATPQSSRSGEIVLLLDWLDIDTNASYKADYIGRTFAAAIENVTIDGIRMAELPMHLASLSRGTVIDDEIAHALGNNGIWVDQVTYLDPHPIAVMQDPPPIVYDNVAFADNYWRTDNDPNNTDSNGEPVNGAYNLNVQWLNAEHAGYDAKGHLAPSGYYNGTIDLNSTSGGEGPIYTDWYGTNGHPARDQTGFYYSSIVGGPRPLSGVWAPSGGTGARMATVPTGDQWANLTDLAAAGGSTFAAGGPLQLNYLEQDRDSSFNATFYLDNDRNPYNNNYAHILGSSVLGASNSVVAGQTAGATDGTAPGTYWLAAQVSDGQGHVRYSYGRQITITGPATYVSDLTPTSASNGYGPYEKDKSNGESAAGDGHTLTINGTTYSKGLGVHAASDISYNLSKQYTQFISDIGVDDEKGGGGSVIFQVYLDGVKSYDSGIMKGSDSSKTVNLSVAGVNTLRLVVTNGGDGADNDHADWAGARLLQTSPAAVPTAPTLLAPQISANQVTLNWSEPLSNQNGFKIERKTGAGGTYATIRDVGATASSFIDSSAVNGTTYYYHVFAYNTGGPSAFSNEISVVPAAPQYTYLSSLTPTSASNGYGPFEKDMSNGEQPAGDGKTITLNGVTYAKGLGVHAPSDISFNLNNKYIQFLSDVGLDDEKGTGGSASFQVYLDGVKAYDSGTINNSSATQSINLNVTGVITLRLVVTDGGDGNANDHADWAGARLVQGQPSSPPAAPTNLIANYNNSTNKVDLTWTDSAGDQTGFRIERKLGTGGTYASVGTVSATTFNFFDSGPFASSSNYFYRVFATNTGGDSASPSNEQNITTPVINTTYLSDLTPTSASNGWGSYEKDKSNGEQATGDGHTITLNGITYAKGIGIHANSDLSFNLNSQYSQFTSDIGVDDEVGGNGTVVFQVYLDGIKVFDSGIMNGSSATQTVNLNVQGKLVLRLVVTNSGDNSDYDHADWAGAKLLS
ncbi:MAG TPA: NPCBM/NEW2 domain-containing protein [Tepidisphaeraceae bacterium]|nr:NPCBM/NEW2 domain-containing protein [Tepidisphaeraceae bacterium]